jgi:hypothetical protein
MMVAIYNFEHSCLHYTAMEMYRAKPSSFMSDDGKFRELIEKIDELLATKNDSYSEEDVIRLNSARNILTGVYEEIESKRKSGGSDNPIGTDNIDLWIKIAEAMMLLAKFLTE